MNIFLESLIGNTREKIRNRAIVELMYSTGARASEISNIKLRDIDLIEGYVYIREGKGCKDRVVPVGKIAIEAVKEYLKVRES